MNAFNETERTTLVADSGSKVRGNDGVMVIARNDGFYVEHFTLAPSFDVICELGPFDSRNEAQMIELAYRAKWNA